MSSISVWFAKLGVAKGEFVVLFLPNCVEYVFAWVAPCKLGAVDTAAVLFTSGTAGSPRAS